MREGARISDGFRGQRLLVRLEKFIFDNLKQQYPNANYQVWNSGDDVESDRWKRTKSADHLVFYKAMVINTTHMRLKHRLKHITQESNRVKRLVDLTEINSAVLMNLFNMNYFSFGSRSAIYRADLKTVINCCKQCTTFYSKDDNNVITGMSFMDLQIGELSGSSISVFTIYCLSLEYVLEHLYALLQHVVKVSNPESIVNLRLSLNSPEVDMDRIYQFLENFGEWIPSYAREGIVLHGNVPKHRL